MQCRTCRKPIQNLSKAKYGQCEFCILPTSTSWPSSSFSVPPSFVQPSVVVSSFGASSVGASVGASVGVNSSFVGCSTLPIGSSFHTGLLVPSASSVSSVLSVSSAPDVLPTSSLSSLGSLSLSGSSGSLSSSASLSTDLSSIDFDLLSSCCQSILHPENDHLKHLKNEPNSTPSDIPRSQKNATSETDLKKISASNVRLSESLPSDSSYNVASQPCKECKWCKQILPLKCFDELHHMKRYFESNQSQQQTNQINQIDQIKHTSRITPPSHTSKFYHDLCRVCRKSVAAEKIKRQQLMSPKSKYETILNGKWTDTHDPIVSCPHCEETVAKSMLIDQYCSLCANKAIKKKNEALLVSYTCKTCEKIKPSRQFAASQWKNIDQDTLDSVGSQLLFQCKNCDLKMKKQAKKQEHVKLLMEEFQCDATQLLNCPQCKEQEHISQLRQLAMCRVCHAKSLEPLKSTKLAKLTKSGKSNKSAKSDKPARPVKPLKSDTSSKSIKP